MVGLYAADELLESTLCSWDVCRVREFFRRCSRDSDVNNQPEDEKNEECDEET